MPFVQGFLRIRSGGHPDQGLPEGEGPVDPGYGIGIEHPDQGLPAPPPGIWPPPVPAHPIVPIPPGGTKPPPGTIWPPVGGYLPPKPDQGLPPPIASGQPPRPDQGLPPTAPGQPPRPDQGLPPTGMDPHPSHPIATGTYWCLVYLPGFGWKYVVVDPSLTIDNALPGPQPTPTPHG